MFRVLAQIKHRVVMAAILAAALPQSARAVEFDFTGYLDARVIAEPAMTDWLSGGLGKYRFGGDRYDMRFEGIGQATLIWDSALSATVLARADQDTVNGLDLLEAYVSWHPARSGKWSWAVKTGAFYPSISLENDDLGWASPYTLTYSAINSWIGEELRTLGSEGTLRYHSETAGTFSLMGSLYCCNDPTGILMADRGWALDDRATGLFERIRIPDVTARQFRQVPPQRTGMFDEIDHRIGWYAGLAWQMPGIGKFSVVRYDNQGDPAMKTFNDTAWDTRFWAFGARTQVDDLVLIAQQLTGYTSVVARGVLQITKFQSGFVLASYGLGSLSTDEVNLDDWRFSMRADLFQTRKPWMVTSPMHEDGRAVTAALSWQGVDWLRVTGEVMMLHSRRGQYVAAGVPSGGLGQSQFQLDLRYFF